MNISCLKKLLILLNIFAVSSSVLFLDKNILHFDSKKFSGENAFEDNYYSLIYKIILKHSLSEKLSKDMNISELIILMNELSKYIDNFGSAGNNINIITKK